MLQEFKKFVLRGNVVDLAVAVVIGAAFTTVVTAIVRDFITPIITIAQQHQHTTFSTYAFHINGTAFLYGDVINTILTFLLTAAVMFFLVVQPVNHITERSRRNQKTVDPTTQKCPECLSEIPIKARRCMYCTSLVKQHTTSET